MRFENENWAQFKGETWKKEINVRDFIQNNYKPYDGDDTPQGTRHVHLTRSDESLFIDGVRFYIETLKKGETQVAASTCGQLSNRDYHQEIDALNTAIREREQEIEENIFLSKTDKKEVRETVQSIYTEIAYTRYDIQKLEDE